MIDEKKSRLYILIGEKIKKYREEKLSQTKLAKAVNLDRASISNIEKGRQHITIEKLWDVATILGIEPHLLLPSVDEVKLAYDDIYVKQLDLSDPGKKWIKEIIEKGVDEHGKNNK